MKIKCLLFVLIAFVKLQAQDVDFSFKDKTLLLEDRVEILVSQMTLEEKVSQMLNASPAIPRLDVPDYDWWSEALHGVARNGKATIFPQPMGMASTFDPDLIEQVATAISDEARAKYTIAQQLGNHNKYAGLTFWSPTVNLYRDPRYGRGQECYGEDPLLMSKIGVAFVKGLQGDDPEMMKVAACAKHYILHSGPEHGKFSFNVEASEQDLYETYLPAFEALVTEAKVEGVMTAYNMIYGQPACTNERFVKDILRDDWSFDGYITSDCGAVWQVSGKQEYADTPQEGAAMTLKAGVNLNCGGAYNTLPKAINEGLIDEQLIHDRCVQLFKTRFRLGMFDADNNHPYTKISPDVIHSDEHIALSREVAQKSIVLLKNENNILPLPTSIKVPYVTGPFANSNDMLMGSYYGVTSGMVTVLEGVADALDQGTSLNYRSGALPFGPNPSDLNWAPNVAKESDVTICVVGTTADYMGEGVDAIASAHGGDILDMKLPENQIKYIKEIIEVKKGPLVLVIASGGPVSLEGIEEHCDAIMQIWYPGEQGGNAVADILFGKVSPSGRLPITFPKNVDQLPPYNDYSMQGRTYKYMTEEPMFPFGFGLTYSETEMKNLSLNTTKVKKNQSVEVAVEVSNVGDFDIDEIVQLYVSPEEVTGGIPIHSIKGFQRVSLAKGDTKTINFTLSPDELKVVDEEGAKVWRKGNYKISVGNASPGELSVRLGATVPQEAIITLK